ncbi:MAG: hypothetical protein OEZ22_14815 [Spirochaetia bacterium]|nr:hypothetical protein [Spirochaetia bacterium]
MIFKFPVNILYFFRLILFLYFVSISYCSQNNNKSSTPEYPCTDLKNSVDKKEIIISKSDYKYLFRRFFGPEYLDIFDGFHYGLFLIDSKPYGYKIYIKNKSTRLVKILSIQNNDIICSINDFKLLWPPFGEFTPETYNYHRNNIKNNYQMVDKFNFSIIRDKTLISNIVIVK